MFNYIKQLYTTWKKHNTVEVGDEWYMEPPKGNPFKPEPTIYIKIEDIKGGWVKYTYVGVQYTYFYAPVKDIKQYFTKVIK